MSDIRKLIKKTHFDFKKNNKLLYYTQNVISLLLPQFCHASVKKILSKTTINNTIMQRVHYYNKLKTQYNCDSNWPFISSLKIKNAPSSYFIDFMSTAKHFDNLKVNCAFGDITETFKKATLVKTRPIHPNNTCSIILKLDQLRHFLFVNDPFPTEKKKGILFGRCALNQKRRVDFFKQYFNHPICNLGQPQTHCEHTKWYTPRATIYDHLKYKFILCLEGFDVASNLKWVMSSNSVAVMPRPTCESWFMENQLKPDYHYICIKKDYSNLEEKLNYYNNHTKELKEIVDNAHQYIKQFKNAKQEKIISLLVMEKFFHFTGQKQSDFFDQ